ncbi:MAG: hypothetical protein LW860_19305 [Xanthomonadaceae bacterium]|jgi:hypothetical protein|nr:hypothetical protein [Xanthomonadaceae bacterium]
MRRASLLRSLGLGLLIAPSVLAQFRSASFNLPRQSIDAGAGRTASASYTLHGTIGQPDAGAPASSASFSLRGGFHVAGAVAPPADALFANGFEP